MSSLIIIGAGGHGNTVYEIAKRSNKYSKIDFLDDCFGSDLIRNKKMKNKIIGKIDSLSSFSILSSYESAFVAIGDNKIRGSLIKKLLDLGLKIPFLKHESAVVSESASICKGVLLAANCVVQSYSKIGVGSIINTSSTIDHDSIIGENVHVCPGVNIAGEVVIGNNSFIGIGSNVIQQINIGHDVFIPAGALVKNDISSFSKIKSDII